MKRAVLCLAGQETQRDVRVVAENMGLQCVGCDSTREAIDRLNSSPYHKVRSQVVCRCL